MRQVEFGEGVDSASRSADSSRDAAWLNGDERAAWIALVALNTLLPPAIDAQLQRDSGIGFFEYTVLAMLSEQPSRTLRMSELARVVNGSLSRLSHVAKRLEDRDLLRRGPLPGNGRITIATLTEAGMAQVVQAAPGHVRAVRELVVDRLSVDQQRGLVTAFLAVLGAVDADAATAIAAAISVRTTDGHGVDGQIGS